MLQKGRIVRSRAEVADVHLFALDGRRIGAMMLVAAERLEMPLRIDGAGDGLGTERAMSRTNSLSEGTAEAEKSGPETATSTLK